MLPRSGDAASVRSACGERGRAYGTSAPADVRSLVPGDLSGNHVASSYLGVPATVRPFFTLFRRVVACVSAPSCARGAPRRRLGCRWGRRGSSAGGRRSACSRRAARGCPGRRGLAARGRFRCSKSCAGAFRARARRHRLRAGVLAGTNLVTACRARLAGLPLEARRHRGAPPRGRPYLGERQLRFHRVVLDPSAVDDGAVFGATRYTLAAGFGAEGVGPPNPRPASRARTTVPGSAGRG